MFNIMGQRFRLVAMAVTLAAAICSCDFTKQADVKFGDQHFKTAIALIELHKLRHNSYPQSLGELDFVGDWDRLALGSVKYELLADGYALDMTKGWIGKPTLVYPSEFWQGLGTRRTNMKP